MAAPTPKKVSFMFVVDLLLLLKQVFIFGKLLV